MPDPVPALPRHVDPRRIGLRRRLYLLAFRAKVMLLYPLGLPVLAAILLARPFLSAQRARRAQQQLARFFSRGLLRLNRIDVRVEGMDRLMAAARGPLVLVCNHNSRFDAYVLLATLPVPFRMFWSDTAHINTEGHSVLARSGRMLDLVFEHDKGDKRRTLAEFRRAEDYVRQGGVLSLFPEGGFSPDERVGPLGSASIKLALRAGASLLPVVMVGTRATFETAWQRRGGRHPVLLRFLEPVDTRGLGGTDVAALQERLQATMNEALGAPAPCAT